MDTPVSHEMDRNELLEAKLALLRQQHRDLDAEIETLGEGALGNNFLLSQLKRRKLKLKDLIARIEDELMPDIIA